MKASGGEGRTSLKSVKGSTRGNKYWSTRACPVKCDYALFVAAFGVLSPSFSWITMNLQGLDSFRSVIPIHSFMHRIGIEFESRINNYKRIILFLRIKRYFNSFIYLFIFDRAKLREMRHQANFEREAIDRCRFSMLWFTTSLVLTLAAFLSIMARFETWIVVLGKRTREKNVIAMDDWQQIKLR